MLMQGYCWPSGHPHPFGRYGAARNRSWPWLSARVPYGTWVPWHNTIHSYSPGSTPLKLLVCWVVGLPIARVLHRAIITPRIVVGAVDQAVRNAEHDGTAAYGCQVRCVVEPLDEDEPVGVDGQNLQGMVVEGEERGNVKGAEGEGGGTR